MIVTVLSLVLLVIMVTRGTILRSASSSVAKAITFASFACVAALAGIALVDRDAFAAGGAAFAVLYTTEQLPQTSQEAIQIFMENYLNGTQLAPPSTWANQFGDVIPLSSPTAKFPVSLLSLLFQETKGEHRFADMKEDSFELLVLEYDEGIEADLLSLKTNVFAYRKWVDGPSRLQLAEQQHIARTVAVDIIEANAACGWDGLALFHDTHKVRNRSSSTFDNLHAAGAFAITIANFEAETTVMMGQVLDENGQKMIRNPDWAILAPTELYQPAVNLFSQALIVSGNAAIDNPFKGRVEVVHVPEFTNTTAWYIVEKNLLRAAMPPWLVGVYDPGPELNLREYTAGNSDWARNTGKIALSKHIWNGHKAVFPHAIRKIPNA